MALQPDLIWRAGPGGPRLDPRLLDLLRALQRNATLRAATAEVGLSYRAAWGLLGEASAQAGGPLVELQRGRGARLTSFGTDLVKADERLRQALAGLADRGQIAPAPQARGGSPLRLAASHDPLLAEFCERYARPAGLIEDAAFRGSEESLAQYSRGAADVVGFHLDAGGGAVLRRYLKPKRDRLIHFAIRDQGLIVAPGNPRKLQTMADVARSHARFVNRQRGSGTRHLLDRLLADAAIAPGSIRGYDTEEFTHLAVAATIATGHADVGLGVHAAATAFGLGFVPLVQEHYWLAARDRTLASAPAQQLLRALSGKPLARLARGKPGYDIGLAGTNIDLKAVLA